MLRCWNLTNGSGDGCASSTGNNGINSLHSAQLKGALKVEMRRYTAPALLILDEVGYLPIDQRGADLLFQVISARYERGSILLTTNKAFKQWPLLFNGDAAIEVTCGGFAAGEGDFVLLLLTSGVWPRPVWPEMRRDRGGFFLDPMERGL